MKTTQRCALFICLASFARLLSGCSGSATDDTRAFIPGTYVTSEINSLENRQDTFIIKKNGTTSENAYEIKHIWHQKPVDLTMKEDYDNIIFTAEYDEASKSFRVDYKSHTVPMTFNPSSGTAKIGTLTARKIK